MKHSYYSQRTGSNPHATGLPLADVVGLFVRVYDRLRSDGYFDEAFGFSCVDEGHVPGRVRDVDLEMLLAARGESPAAFDRRCIPPGYVASRSHTAGIFPRRALPIGRITGLGATLDFHHGLLAVRKKDLWPIDEWHSRRRLPPRLKRRTFGGLITKTYVITRRAIYGRRDVESQFSTVSPLNRAKSGVFAVTSTRSFTWAMAAIWPSTNGAGVPSASRRARSRPCQSAATSSYGRMGNDSRTTS